MIKKKDDKGNTDHDVATTSPYLVEKVTPVKLAEPPKVGDKNTAPTTTAADDLRTEGQRWTNRLWESMQAYIAASVVTMCLIVNAYIVIWQHRPDITEAQMAAANSANQNINILASLIIGFYFGRVNHQREAGVQKGDIGR